jgi:hypothetical protein
VIKLFESPELDYRGVQIPSLLNWAAFTLADEPSPAEIRLAGVAARMAVEFHLAELCRQHGPPKGERWHHYALRLLKVRVFTMGDYRQCRRIARLAAKAVHGKPFEIERARDLFERVSEFVN